MAAAINILLVEDNEGDIELTKIAFEEGNLSSTLSIAHDGVEAMEYLTCQGRFHDAVRPDLVLLDLNMPRMGGREFLETVKQDAKLKSIPVIVFTSSNARLDILDCYERYASCYILKPSNVENLIGVTKQIEDFWGNLVQIPDLVG